MKKRGVMRKGYIRSLKALATCLERSRPHSQWLVDLREDHSHHPEQEPHIPKQVKRSIKLMGGTHLTGKPNGQTCCHTQLLLHKFKRGLSLKKSQQACSPVQLQAHEMPLHNIDAPVRQHSGQWSRHMALNISRPRKDQLEHCRSKALAIARQISHS